jgi:hypothetical protein
VLSCRSVPVLDLVFVGHDTDRTVGTRSATCRTPRKPNAET